VRLRPSCAACPNLTPLWHQLGVTLATKHSQAQERTRRLPRKEPLADTCCPLSGAGSVEESTGRRASNSERRGRVASLRASEPTRSHSYEELESESSVTAQSPAMTASQKRCLVPPQSHAGS